MFVVVAHFIERTPLKDSFFLAHVNLGQVGVVIFFVISGMVIPYSLKQGRHALAVFAVSRFFRLYPAYWFSIALAVASSDWFLSTPVPLSTVLINMTMLQAAVQTPDLFGVYWTLIIEMFFYVACAALFSVGLLGKAWVRQRGNRVAGSGADLCDHQVLSGQKDSRGAAVVPLNHVFRQSVAGCQPGPGAWASSPIRRCLVGIIRVFASDYLPAGLQRRSGLQGKSAGLYDQLSDRYGHCPCRDVVPAQKHQQPDVPGHDQLFDVSDTPVLSGVGGVCDRPAGTIRCCGFSELLAGDAGNGQCRLCIAGKTRYWLGQGDQFEIAARRQQKSAGLRIESVL